MVKKFVRHSHMRHIHNDMKIPVEVLDHIFSFLVPHRAILIACSKDPVLSPIVERHLYHLLSVVISSDRWIDVNHSHNIDPDHLCKLLSENPRIPNYVRLLGIHVGFDLRDVHKERLDAFAKTLLPRFQVLECILLTGRSCDESYCPEGFRAALGDRLNIPTVKEVCIIGNNFPLSLLDNCKNVKILALSGLFVTKPSLRVRISAHPRLRTLTLSTGFISPSLLTWLKPHISELQSLKSSLASLELLSELLGVCSQSLNKLDIDLYEADHLFQTREVDINPSPELSPVPNLRHLTLRTIIAMAFDDDDHTLEHHYSSLPMAAEVIKFFAPSLHYLVLDIEIDRGLTKIDLSPLAVLGAASESVSIPHIDMYIHTGIPSVLTRTQMSSSLGVNENLMRLIKDGILTVHLETIAPVRTEGKWASMIRP